MLSELRMLYKDYITASTPINVELLKSWGGMESCSSSDNLASSADSITRISSFRFDNKKKKPNL